MRDSAGEISMKQILKSGLRDSQEIPRDSTERY